MQATTWPILGYPSLVYLQFKAKPYYDEDAIISTRQNDSLRITAASNVRCFDSWEWGKVRKIGPTVA